MLTFADMDKPYVDLSKSPLAILGILLFVAGLILQYSFIYGFEGAFYGIATMFCGAFYAIAGIGVSALYISPKLQNQLQLIALLIPILIVATFQILPIDIMSSFIETLPRKK